MEVNIKCIFSEGQSFLMVLCSFSFFIPLPPVSLVSVTPASEGWATGLCLHVGLEKEKGSTPACPGCFWPLVITDKMFNLMRGQKTMFFPRVDWVG